MNKGFFGIGIFNWQKDCNVGTLWRSAYIFGASFIFTIGRAYKHQCSDTVKAYRHIPLFNYLNCETFLSLLPKDCQLVGIENKENSHALTDYVHPRRAIYLLGSEGAGITECMLNKCHEIVRIHTEKDICLNVSTAGSIVMYDRFIKGIKKD